MYFLLYFKMYTKIKMRNLRYALIRQYDDIDVYKFKSNKIKEYSRYQDYYTDIKKENFRHQKNKNFNYVSNKKVIIENDRDNFCVMYIIFRIFDNKIYYGITEDAIEFNPEKDTLLYYEEIDLRKRFKSVLVEFYFENQLKRFYDKYEPMYYALFECDNMGREPKMDYQSFNTDDVYKSYFFEIPKMPDNFKLTEQNPIRPRKTPIGIRNYVYNKNIENLLDNTYYNNRAREEYENEYRHTRVDNQYNINTPEAMFFDFDESMKPDLSYMYINKERFDFDQNAQHVNVPKGDFALYYNKRQKRIGIRYVHPMWFNEEKEPNPLLRSYVYIKRLSNKELRKPMEEQIIDFYTKEHFHLCRLKYDKKDIEDQKQKSVSFKDFENKFNYYKSHYRRRQPIPELFPNNPYVPDYIRNRY